ncbi:aquaporin [Ophiobolus disseminans]|uniref:Aquaporin n=1 Tax=Ophiobolus disseminans TaxID=1469910 RepID=A0A6A7A594_9PLEO|nr:aquaporin [Ophiobolus disseminans]
MNVDRPTRGLRVPWQNRHGQHPSHNEGNVERRLPFLNILPKAVKGHLVAAVGEFVGTFMFLLFALGGTNVVNTAPPEGANAVDLSANPSKIMYIALVFGMSLAVNAWVFFRISGGLFNPAVTLGMMVVGATGYIRGALVIVAQIVGGIAASAVVSGMMPNELAVRTELGGGTTVVQGLFIEMFLTAQLVFTIFMLATEKHEGTFIAPVGIGLSLFVAELMGVFYTGGSVNPARSFGPCVVTHTFNSYHWIYWVGPVLGALLASTFYMFVKALEYETVNLDVADPKATLGEKVDRAEKADQRATLQTPTSPAHSGSAASAETYVQASTLENGYSPRR